MNYDYPKYSKKDYYQGNHYQNRRNYYYKPNGYKKNSFFNYNRKKKIIYENTYDEQNTCDIETKDNSFSQSTNSNSRKHSYCENLSENNDINQNPSFINSFKDAFNTQKCDIVPKINLSKNELKSAYFVPKKYKENKDLIKTESIIDNNEHQNNEENIDILEINLKISKDKNILFQLKKFDDMFSVVNDIIEKNEIRKELKMYLIKKVIRALNSIYGMMNLELKKEDIEFLKIIKDNYL